MTPMTKREPKLRRNAAAGHRLEDVLPIAVVIAAGCEPCADKMVRQALERGSAPSSIARTLRIVGHLRTLDCLVRAVGPEVVARMEEPLRTAQKALENGACRSMKKAMDRRTDLRQRTVG